MENTLAKLYARGVIAAGALFAASLTWPPLAVAAIAVLASLPLVAAWTAAARARADGDRDAVSAISLSAVGLGIAVVVGLLVRQA